MAGQDNKNDLLIRIKKLEEQVKAMALLGSKNVLTADDVALLTGLSKSHIYKLTCYKQIPYYKCNGKSIYFDKTEIENWMKEKRVFTVDEERFFSEARSETFATDNMFNVYLVKKDKDKTRKLTKDEILYIFENYLRRFCMLRDTNSCCVIRDGEPIFEVRLIGSEMVEPCARIFKPEKCRYNEHE